MTFAVFRFCDFRFCGVSVCDVAILRFCSFAIVRDFSLFVREWPSFAMLTVLRFFDFARFEFLGAFRARGFCDCCDCEIFFFFASFLF